MTGRALMIGLLRARGGPGYAVYRAGTRPPRSSPAERAAGQAPEGAEAMDLPDWLWGQLVREVGRPRAATIAGTLRRRAPVMLRANLRAGTRDAARARLATEGIVAEPDDISPSALRVVEGARRIRNSAAFATGLSSCRTGRARPSWMNYAFQRGENTGLLRWRRGKGAGHGGAGRDGGLCP